jgi:hypothetical protein
MEEKSIPYDRDVLGRVLTYHQRKDITSCECGWAELGKSHPEHVVDIYEMTIKETSGTYI